MRRTPLLAVLVCLLALFFVQFSSGAIYIDQDTLDDYNIGDEIAFSFVIEEDLPVSDFAEVVFDCETTQQVVFKQFVSFVHTDREEFNVSFFANLEGDCFFEVNFDDDSERTEFFDVTSNLDVDVFLSSSVFLPGEIVYVNGSAEKRSSETFDYDIEVSINDFVEKIIGFSQEDFSFNVSIDPDMSAGDYSLRMYFVERNIFGEILNTRTYRTDITVLSQPTAIDLLFIEQFEPPYDFNIRALLRDQSGEIMSNETLVLKIFDPQNNLYYDGSISSEENMSFFFPSDAEIGGWKVRAFFGSVDVTRPFYVQEHRDVTVSFVNSTSYVTITNIGNMVYEGTVDITLSNASGNITVPFNVHIPIGGQVNETIPYAGEYNITTEDGSYFNVIITGNVIGALGGNFSIIVFVIVCILLIVLIFFFFFSRRKFKESKVMGSPARTQKPSSFVLSNKKNIKFRFFKRKRKDLQQTLSSFSTHEAQVPKDEVQKLIDSHAVRHDVDVTPYHEERKEEKKEEGRGAHKKSDGGFIDMSEKENAQPSQKRGSESLLATSMPPSAKKRVYSLFFRHDSEDLVILLKTYGLNIYKVGDMRFSLLKTSKQADSILFNLAKKIVLHTNCKDVLIHKMDFDNSHALSSWFKPIKQALNERPGILVSGPIFTALRDRKSFVHFKNIRASSKESVIKLYRYIASE